MVSAGIGSVCVELFLGVNDRRSGRAGVICSRPKHTDWYYSESEILLHGRCVRDTDRNKVTAARSLIWYIVPFRRGLELFVTLWHCDCDTLYLLPLMMERWKGRVALVTGASVGIGAAVARALVQHGMKVVGCARNVDKIEVNDLKASC